MKKILLLFGGNSPEHYISCLSAKTIIEKIDYSKYELTTVGIDKNNNFYLFNDHLTYLENGSWLKAKGIKLISNIITFISQFDIVFPITHGNSGEDGKLQGLLDFFEIKYVGCKTLTSASLMDKKRAKLVFKHLNIPQVPYLTVSFPQYSLSEIIKKLKFPLIVKPANGGSSIGINQANNKKELIKALKEASQYDKSIIIEKFIKARELECSLLETKKITISTIGEIIPSNDFYDYQAKYIDNKSKIIIPAKVPKKVKNDLEKYLKKVFTELEIKGYARADFLYNELNQKVYLNEINTIPGFTEISMFPQLLIFDGFNLTDIITILLENA